jgi:hypothetical protein
MEARNLAQASPFTEAERTFGRLVEDLQAEERMHLDLSQLEKMLGEQGRELIRQLLQGHLELRAQSAVSEPVVGTDGVRRSERRTSSRLVETVFGTVVVGRERFHRAGSPGLSPLDAELNLPPQRASLEAQKRVAEEAARGSYDEVVTTIDRTTGADIAKRQAEEIAVHAATDFDDFYETLREVPEFHGKSDPNKIIVLTSDGKGVPVRKEDLRPATRRAAETKKRKYKLDKRLAKGERRQRTRMATVAAVYAVAPFERTPEQVLAALLRSEEYAVEKRPKPEKKRVWASLEKTVEDVLAEVFAEGLARDPDLLSPWVALIDGNEPQLNELVDRSSEFGIELTVIIDVIHVLGYLWKAGLVFNKEGTNELERWVSDRLLEILRGHSSEVAGGIRRSATKRGISDEKRRPADDCADYLLKYGPFLRYDKYLASGYPIATGVVEGACRHLVGQRMDVGCWSLSGAEAVLKLRALRCSGDFDEYWEYHEKMELERNHRQNYENGQIPAVAPRKSSVAPSRRNRPDLKVIK